MELTPELLLEAKFAPARRGYDMNEVDDFLERCAEGLDVLLNRLKAEFERAERAEETVAELRAGLDRGGPAEPEATDAAPAAPAGDTVEPHAAVGGVDDAAPSAQPPVEEPMRILIAAERTAEAAIADARAEAEQIRTEAESVASTTRSEAEALLARSRSEAEAEARRAGEETRRAIEAEVLSLREDRDALTRDVRLLDQWLDEQRARLATTARDLQRLVDDPAALRELPVPELHEGRTEQAAGDQAAIDQTAGDQAAGDGPGPDRGADDDALDPADPDAELADGEPTQAVDAVEDPRPFDGAASTNGAAATDRPWSGSDVAR